MRVLSYLRMCFALSMAASLAGCVSLTSYKAGDPALRNDNTAKTMKTGLVPYSLPWTTVIVTATYTLTKCTDTDVSIATSAAIDTETEPDPAALYYIDSQAFQRFGLLKTSDLKINVNANGTVQTLNGHISDQTGTILAATLSAVMNAAVATGAHALAANTSKCNDDFYNALQQIKADQDKLNNSPASGAGSLSAADKVNIQADIDAQTKRLTITARTRVDLNTASLTNGSTIIDQASPIAPWFKGGVLPAFPAGLPNPSQLEVLVKSQGSVADEADTILAGPAAGAPSIPIDGLVYRVPVPVRVRACFGVCAATDGLADASNQAAEKTGVLISQLGPALVAPLDNAFLRDSDLILSQDANGNLTSVEFKQTSTVSTFLDGIAQVFTTQQSQNIAATNAESSALNAQSQALTSKATAATTNAGLADAVLAKQADCLNQQAAIIKAGGTPKVSCQ